MQISICGGGALGHVISGTLAAHDDFEVSMLSGHSGKWTNDIRIALPDSKEITSHIKCISSDPKEVVSHADYIIFCLPGFMIASTLRKIKPFLKKGAIVGSVVSSNGFFWMAQSILSERNPYFGLQRVPYIARVKNYGHSAVLKGYKRVLKVAVSENGDKEKIQNDLASFFNTRIKILSSFWAAALTNSNPLLHTSRLYALFKDYYPGMIYPEEPLFYEDWDLLSSEMVIACDKEFQQTIEHLPFDASEVPPLLKHYDSVDAKSLTDKLKSIKAFKGIRLKMKEVPGGVVPDWENRYFAEDIPYGLLIVKSFASFFKEPSPAIDKILYWAQDKMNKEYLKGGMLKGKDVAHSGIPQNYARSIKNLINNPGLL